MRNILFLEQFSNIGGGQRMLLNLLAGLKKNDFTPFVIIPGSGQLSEKLDSLGVKYFVLPMGSFSTGKKTVFDFLKYAFLMPALIYRCIFIIKENRIGLVYANAPRTYIWGTIAAKMTRRRIVWHIHLVLSGLERIISAFMARYWVDKIVAVSKYAAAVFIGSDKDLASKIEVVLNGIDGAVFSRGIEDNRIRKEFDIADDQKVVSFIGRITPLKGIDVLIEAAKKVLAENGKAVFLIVGSVLSNDRKDEKYNEYLLKLAEKGKNDKYIKFVGQRKDIPQIMSATDILVMPSVGPESFSLTVLEAMFAGKAIISTSSGGQAELIENGKTGYLVQPNDPDGLAEKIKLCISNPDLCRKIGIAAQKKAKEEFSLQKFQKEIGKILGDIFIK